MNVEMLKEYEFSSVTDSSRQGILRVFESKNIPFKIKRVFSVLNLEAHTNRGKHAHKVCNQLICCLSGKVNLICDDGSTKEENVITPMSKGILVPAGVWAEQEYLESNSVILVFCDQSYEEADYIHDYDEFLEYKKES